MYTCLNNIYPSIEEVRCWAYDEDLIFTEQDEDLILYSHRYVPILMELASDQECPKNYYCLTILTAFSAEQLARRLATSIEEIEQHIKAFDGSISADVKKWADNFSEFSELIVSVR